MPVLMYHGGVLNQGVKHTKCKKVYHKVVVIQWICLLSSHEAERDLDKHLSSHSRPQSKPTGGTRPSNGTGSPHTPYFDIAQKDTKEERIKPNDLVLKFKVSICVVKHPFNWWGYSAFGPFCALFS